MPRSAYQVSLTQEPSTVNINDAAQRFARATAILMQIAQRAGLDVSTAYSTVTATQRDMTISKQPHNDTQQTVN